MGDGYEFNSSELGSELPRIGVVHKRFRPRPRPYQLHVITHTHNFTQWAWDHAEEGSNLRPSREPPFDCALLRDVSCHTARRLARTSSNSNRRAAFAAHASMVLASALCYPAIAPRLPNGTLRNKHAPQSQRVHHLPRRTVSTTKSRARRPARPYSSSSAPTVVADLDA